MGLINRLIKLHMGLDSELDVQTAAASIEKNISFSGTNIYILAFAIIIASVGLNVNSIPVIIGAMLISPLMGPIVGIGLSLGTNNLSFFRKAVMNLGVMVAISIAASTLYFLLTPLRLENPTELLARTNPTIYDVLIAFFGGFAGIIETSRKDRGTVLSGVAIATALMPPLCTIGYGLSQLNMHYTFGALYLFFINSVFIALATFLGVKFLGYENAVYANEASRRRIRRTMGTIITIIIIPSIISAVSIVRENNFDRSAATFVRNAKSLSEHLVYDYHVDHDASPSVVELYLLSDELTEAQTQSLYSLAEEQGIMPSQLKLNISSSGTAASSKAMADLYQHTDALIFAKDSIISQLRLQLKRQQDSLSHLPQVAEEIRVQYPTVREVTIARGSRMGSEADTAVGQEVLVVVKSSKPLGQANRRQMEEWLGIRLQGERVRVIED